MKKLYAARSDQISARFVARKRRLVDERHPRSASRQHQSGDAACRTGSNDKDIDRQVVHRPLAIAEL